MLVNLQQANFALGWSPQVNVYTYRTAIVIPPRIELDREECRQLETWLATLGGRSLDNHTVYEVAYNGGKMCFWFTDSRVYIGTNLEVGGY